MKKPYLNILWGDYSNGQLNRVGFFKSALIISSLAVLFLVLILFLIFGAVNIVGGNLQEAQTYITQKLEIPFLIVSVFVIIGLIFAKINICAKRIRNIGLPGWVSLIIAISFNLIVHNIAGQNTGYLFSFLVLLILFLRHQAL